MRQRSLPTATSRPTATRLVTGALACLTMVLAVLAGPSVGVAGAQERRVVVIGDSIILGAESALVGAFQGAGWQISFDAQVSRSTTAALDAIEAHRAELTDSLILSFGANDAGNPATFRTRVERVLAATASVPHVYWLTIREVRDYYPAANQVLREVAAAHPNVTIVDWHAATAGNDGLTAGDGLHLNGAGAALMAEVLVGTVVNGVAPAPAAPPPPPPTAAPTTVAPPPTEPPTTPVPTTAAPGTTSTAPSSTTTSTAPERDEREERAAELQEVDDTSTIDLGDAAGWTATGGLVLVLAVLLLGGLGLGIWSLYSTRSRGREGAAPEQSPQHPAVRAQQRAERIAEATRAAASSSVGAGQEPPPNP